MSKVLTALLLVLCTLSAMAQRTQLIKGNIIDKESKTPVIGAIVTVTDIQPAKGGVTDEQGNFLINDIPVGKHTINITSIGYQPLVISGVLVTSAKEVVLPLEMEESSIKMGDVVVKHRKDHVNEMAMVSAKTFDVQETERYAGSRSDPARMASNFAGVQGADDSRNDIIIRGNSPQGLLWRLEDIDIPNPNHFAIPGTSGGPVSMLNNKTLGNSDFLTGAFPAEYGNSTAGVFDLKMRNGNNERYEYTAQLGFLGTELAAEGPISKKHGSSFLITYRYSTLQLFQGLNIKIGTSSVPNYQDAAFKFNFPIGKKSNLALFGVGGLSKIDLIVSNLKERPEELYGESDRDQYFYSNTGFGGVSFSHIINSTTYTKIVVAQSANEIGAHHDKVFRDANYLVDSIKSVLDYTFGTNSTVAHWYINKKLSAKQTIKAGIINNYYNVNYVDSSRQYPVTRQDWQQRLNYQGGTDLVQAYIQYKYRPNDALTFIGGLHAQYLTHNQSKSLEPRVAAKWRASDADVVTFAYGLHSQMQPLYMYFSHLPAAPATAMHNYDVGFTKSHHLVAGYDHSFSNVLRVRTEVYYQYLFNIPIEIKSGSSYSGLDQGSSFSRVFPDTLQNKGTGYNYGLELTIEKSFSKGFYIMATGSVFDSKAKGNDGVLRNTDYNSHFAVNVLGGYEHKLGKYSTMLAGGKITYAGGKLYSPPDVAASNTKNDYVIIESQRNTLKFPDYFRADIKLGVRLNAKKYTHEIALDLVNVLGTKNLLSLTYSSDLAAQGQYPFIKQYQLGFLPLFYYRIDFGNGKHR
ncbi:MAG: TonB-dependent receptor [Bacteroidetes bacterium]|nr:TonB-dependent receptor [Bacteroidota bacterium]